MRLLAKIFGGLAGLLILFLGVGFLLPGAWEARAGGFVPAPPASVFLLMADLSRWSSWSPMPEPGLESFGNTQGVGAGLRWNDPQYGKGEMVVTSSTSPSELVYRVVVEGGGLTIVGTLTLTPEGEGTRVRWVEEGDFGWNPLMGFTAMGMPEAQGEALRESLRALAELFSGG
jgi:hypothetical protein